MTAEEKGNSTAFATAPGATTPKSVGPTHSSPYGTASTTGSLPEISLPPPTIEKRSSSDLIIFRDENGNLSPVRDLTKKKKREGPATVCGDSDSDAEEWMADDDGGFSPKKTNGPSTSFGAWKPAALLPTLRGSLPALRVARRSHLILLLIGILLGPNIGLLAYLCGVSAPSGSARPAPSPKPEPAYGEQYQPGGFWSTKFEMRSPEPTPRIEPRPEPTGDGFWLIPMALWKRGVLLIPAFAGWA
jgi:hypothetical protein